MKKYIILSLSLLFTLHTFSFSLNAQMPQDLEDYFEDFLKSLFEEPIPVAAGVIAKAEPDECFYGVGDSDNEFDPEGIDCEECEEDGGQGKVNQSYVWAMAKDHYNIWFGTGPNINCLVSGALFGSFIDNIETPSYVCEFENSILTPPNGYGGTPIGDWRPFRVYMYNIHNSDLVDKTSDITGPGAALIGVTLGVRAMGIHNDVVIFGGPDLNPFNGSGGINLFAFQASTGSYIGATTLTDYDNIRKFLVVNGVMYTAVGTDDDGAVLRWTGNVGSPFLFELVGELESDGAELAYHEGRIFVNTWPSEFGTDLATLYMSPVVPPGGLTNSHANSWTEVWNVGEYEPDPVTARTYGGGALISFGGYLWWGTMHVPLLSSFAHFVTYGPPGADILEDELDYLLGLLGPHRAITIFRGQNFGQAGQNIRIAYGMPYLPAFHPIDHVWDIVPNNMNQHPLFGLSGFYNIFNNYTWSMAVCENTLYVGTMDWSYLLFGDLVNSLLDPQAMPFDFVGMMEGEESQQMMVSALEDFVETFDPNMYFGADLFCFPDPNQKADLVSRNGMGNPTSYGIRNMCAAGDILYLGMANPMNLLTCSNASPGRGGWELVSMYCPRKIPTINQWAILILGLTLLVFGTVVLKSRVKAF